jgi:hypothetical protein
VALRVSSGSHVQDDPSRSLAPLTIDRKCKTYVGFPDPGRPINNGQSPRKESSTQHLIQLLDPKPDPLVHRGNPPNALRLGRASFVGGKFYCLPQRRIFVTRGPVQ